LASVALQRMDERLPWYRALSPDERSWVGLVAQAGIAAFVAWHADRDKELTITADVFGTAPRELTRSISLQQTLELLRTVVDSVEDHVAQMAAPGAEQELRESVLRYSREVAFAAARIYARAAEARGAWDARLEALVVDALIQGEADDALRSQAAALGWNSADRVIVVVGSTPLGHIENIVDDIRRTARTSSADALVGVQGDRILVVVGHADEPSEPAGRMTSHFGPGPVIIGPEMPDLTSAGRSARAALSGLVAVRAWPEAPRPVNADDLLPERLLSGDSTARRALIDRVYRPLSEADPSLLETAAGYLHLGRSVEASARTLFVHPNTVRYRLRRVADITGWDPTSAREGFVIQLAISAGRLSDPPPKP
jgi:hypothetical protein